MPGEVLLTSAPHPFKLARRVTALPEGLSISQMLAASGITLRSHEHAVVFADGRRIPESWWPLVRPKAGAHLELRVVPMGGGDSGKSPLRILLTIAVMAASFAFGKGLGASLFGHAANATQLGTAIIGMGGLLLVNALAPIRPAKLGDLSGTSGDTSPALFIEGARNRATPFGVVPVLLGRYRMVPNYGAPPYTEIIGDKHFVRMLFVHAIGPVQIDTSTLQIGETPLTSYLGVETEHRAGYDSDTDLTLYQAQVTQEDITVALEIATGWQTRTSQPDADELSVDITFPQGCVFIDQNGRRLWWRVAAELQYRKVGDVAWSYPAFTATTTNATSGLAIYFDHAKAAPFRHGFRWSTGERAQYEIRFRRVDVSQPLGLVEVEPNNTAFDDLVWSAVRTFTNADRLQAN